MSPQFVYVLVSADGDCYAELAYASIRLLTATHPDARVKVLVDGPTARSLKDRRSKVLEAAELVVHEDTGQLTPGYRSRFLKTSMRRLVEGDFVYLDVDTLPIRPLDALFEPNAQLAAAYDRTPENPQPHCPAWIESYFGALGWRFPLPQYFNTGVLYFPDNAAARSLGELWHTRWQQTAALGFHYDQPAFNSSIDTAGAPVRPLPTRFNAMISIEPEHAAEAAIVHLFANGRAPRQNAVSALLRSIAKNREIDWQDARETLRNDPLIETPARAGGGVVRRYLAAAKAWLRTV